MLGQGTHRAPAWLLSAPTLATGTHPLTAYFAGDSTYAPSTSATVNVVISSSTGPGPSQPLLSFTPGEFYQPETGTTSSYSDVAIDAAGDEFALDSSIGSVTEYSVAEGRTITFVPADSYVDPGGYMMTHPSDLAVAPSGGTVYITDTPANLIAEATSAGSLFLSDSELYGLGDCNGGTPSGFASLSSPTGISIGPVSKTSTIPNSAGYDLYVADSGDKRVLEINPVGGNTAACGYYPGGVVDAILAGTGSPSGPALVDPLSVVASGSNVYIADAPPAINNTSQGAGTIYENGVAITNSDIVFPYSLAIDAAGDLYYSDQSLSQVWRIDTQGNFLPVAGNGLNNSAADLHRRCSVPGYANQHPHALWIGSQRQRLHLHRRRGNRRADRRGECDHRDADFPESVDVDHQQSSHRYGHRYCCNAHWRIEHLHRSLPHQRRPWRLCNLRRDLQHDRIHSDPR